MTRPNFFIVGAPKCGTTALHAYLKTHPQIFVPTIKEPNYFCTDFPGYRKFEDEPSYLAQFASAPATATAIGEASVHYLYSDVAIPQAYEFNPAARFIAMVRNPITFLPSLHAQFRYAFRETEADLESAWRLQAARARGEQLPKNCVAPRFLQYGEHASMGGQVERMLQVLPREQTLILLQDDLHRDAAGVYAQVLDFLQLPHDGRSEFPRLNAAKTHRFPRLSEFAMRPPFPLNIVKNSMKSMLGLRETKLGKRIYYGLCKSTEKSAISDAFHAELVEFFRDDVAKLERILDRDLSHWLQRNHNTAARAA